MKNYTDEELEKQFKKILYFYKSRYSPTENPKVFLLGGQPGAGKSGLENAINIENEYISISGDDYREYHPKFEELNIRYGKESSKHTQQWAGEITERLIKELGKLIIEGTLRTAELPLKEAYRFKKNGYEVELNIVVVKPEKSYLGTLLRYEQMITKGKTPRMTPKEHHDLVVNSIGNNLEIIYNSKVFDNIKLFDRENNLLYNYKESPGINPKDIIDKEFKRKWVKEELNKYRKDWQSLFKMLEKREAALGEVEPIKITMNKIVKNINNKEIKRREIPKKERVNKKITEKER